MEPSLASSGGSPPLIGPGDTATLADIKKHFDRQDKSSDVKIEENVADECDIDFGIHSLHHRTWALKRDCAASQDKSSVVNVADECDIDFEIHSLHHRMWALEVTMHKVSDKLSHLVTLAEAQDTRLRGASKNYWTAQLSTQRKVDTLARQTSEGFSSMYGFMHVMRGMMHNEEEPDDAQNSSTIPDPKPKETAEDVEVQYITSKMRSTKWSSPPAGDD
jgi:hypothetical protein